jgi:DNA-binding transcriptional ArsR family regulator
MLACWSQPEAFGEDYLSALRAYVQVFFAEEENRICAALEEAQQRAQAMAERLAIPDLLEALSQGVRFASLPDLNELVLAPSYWSTPLVFYRLIDEHSMLLLYGARPDTVSLVPGEVVPDALLRALKALADPTRLRILHYLAAKPQTPAQLSRRLRLRPPTVVHHLSVLRLAGLVYLTLEPGDERRYAARIEMLSSTFEQLHGFIGQGSAKSVREVIPPPIKE